MQKGLPSEALCVGGYASADSAEEHGGTTGSARGAPFSDSDGLFNRSAEIREPDAEGI